MSDSQGLHLEQEPKYTVRDGRIVNRVSGEAIPDDEPLFIFRARDKFAFAAISYYSSMVPAGEHAEAVKKRVEDFLEFQDAHPERMKVPDTATNSGAQHEAGG